MSLRRLIPRHTRCRRTKPHPGPLPSAGAALARATGLGPLLALAVTCTAAAGADWPMWRYDARRSAVSPTPLPDALRLEWTRHFAPLSHTWEDPLNQDLMPFGRLHEPLVVGRTLLVASSDHDRLVALDVETGDERWTRHLDGPIRVPPAAAAGRVYVASDDGCLYCIDVETGDILWRFRGGPDDRRVLGNGRLVSAWPARGGPVVAGSVVYFAAGIWPFMGVFIHALDAATGEVIWTNDSSGSLYILQPHNSPAYGGVAPQGALVAAGDRLLVPGGRSVPACFDLHTGEFLYYHLSRYNKTGGAFVCAAGESFVNYHRDGVASLYDLPSGEARLSRFGGVPAAAQDTLYCAGASIAAFDLAGLHLAEYDEQVKNNDTGEIETVRRSRWEMASLWSIEADASGDLIRAGNRLYAGGAGQITAVALPATGETPSVCWRIQVEGTVGRLVAGADRLFAVTEEGALYAFGATGRPPHAHPPLAVPDPPDPARLHDVRDLIQSTGVRDGYCLAYGLEDGGLLDALARQSDLEIIAVDPDPERVERLRHRFAAAGLYGARISLHVGDPSSFAAPPYIASLILFEDLERAGYDAPGFVGRIHHSLRPYGGVACFPASDAVVTTLRAAASGLEQAAVELAGAMALLRRDGPLPGAAPWTHQYGDVANTVKSNDRRVRLPLGLLWFGGSSNVDVLPRHGHGPPEQVLGGRLFIEGLDCLSARDVYTGRLLWKRTFPDLATFGVYYDATYSYAPLSTAYNQVHIPGANARGTNFVVASDRIYLAAAGGCYVLDPASGETLARFRLGAAGEPEPAWGYLGVYEDSLLIGAGAVQYTDFLELTAEQRKRASNNLDTNSSRKLVVLDRYTGEPRWSYVSRLGLRHNAIVAGGGRIYCVDGLSDMVAEALARRGRHVTDEEALIAFGARDGAVAWRVDEPIAGTWLGYSNEHDLLLEAGRPSRDTVADEPGKGMVARRGADGTVIWRNDVTYGGPCILHGRTVITDRHAFDLLTGAQRMRQAPLTGAQEPWAYTRRYGCNYNIASEYLITFRSAAAGYYDLETDGGTGNFGGFKSGCTSNLIAADGVLNAPDYTRTCSCSYQNQTSLALVHMPGIEQWVTYLSEDAGLPIQRVGVNLGAPGNRRAADGCFWIAHPLLPRVDHPERESGLNVDVASELAPAGSYYTQHATRIAGGEGADWVAASGCRGLKRLEIDLRTASAATYSVSLHFADPDHDRPGARTFDVLLEGQQVLDDLDVAALAGGRNRALVRNFPSVTVKDGRLTLELAASPTATDDPATLPVLSGLRLERLSQ